ncbi:MAG: hypothetical protein PWP65_1780 [Clostridia bacterium]|nr:hypothetical protein [Clostridia bacterium]
MVRAFEQGPIRPPSEAYSLLLRLTRGCPWNKCEFCHTYKNITFSRRTVEEIKQEIRNIKELATRLQEASWSLGLGGRMDQRVVLAVLKQTGIDCTQLALWLSRGAKTVFLQDADCLIMKTEELLEVLQFLTETFPSVERITTYGRAKSLLRKSVDELKKLKEAGIKRIHTGLESGCDVVLDYVRKGARAEEYIEAAHRVKEAGIEQCEYIILGLGGRRWSREHALKTAEVLSAINPEYIRVHTLAVGPDMPLWKKVQSGDFERLSEDEIIQEERLLLEHLEGIRSQFICIHSLNLLNEINGRLPEDKEEMLGIIDAYLALPEEERWNYKLGRRAMAYQCLADMQNKTIYQQVQAAVENLKAAGRLEEALEELRRRCV